MEQLRRNKAPRIFPWLLGVISLVFTPLTLSFRVSDVSIGFVWAQLFPIVSALAYGPAGGLISGIAGGSWFPFLLWPGNGYANLFTSLDSLAFYALLGLVSRRAVFPRFAGLLMTKGHRGSGIGGAGGAEPQTGTHSINGQGRHFSPPRQIILFISVYLPLRGVLFWLLFNPLLSLNPPFWLSVWDGPLPDTTVLNIIAKHAVTTCVQVLTAGIMLRLNPLRKVLGIETQYKMKRNTFILWFTLGIALGIWGILQVFQGIFLPLDPNQAQDFYKLTLITFFIGWIIALRVVITYVENAIWAQVQLERTEGQFRIIGERANDLISITDYDGRCVYVSPSVQRILGYDPQEVLGSHPVETIHPEDQPMIRDYYRMIQEGADPGIPHFDYRTRRKDGVWIWLESVPQAVPGDSLQGKRILVISRDITQWKKDQRTITQALQEKEVLLRELYHRTKNNMQTIISMLYLKAAASDQPEVQALVSDIHGKITAMSEIHQLLYRSGNLNQVDMQTYIQEFCRLTVRGFQATPEQIGFQVRSTGIFLPLDQALPCGLIISELVTNSYKYAFPQHSRGTISIAIEASPTHYTLSYRDSGPGLSHPPDSQEAPSNTPDHPPYHPEGMGLQIIRNLAESQLGGSFTLLGGPGFAAAVVFPRSGRNTGESRADRP